jgi:outer membrane immunogenic protein
MFKRFALAAAVVIGWAGVAVAADLPTMKPAPAAAAPWSYNWSGCYIGAEGGGSWMRTGSKALAGPSAGDQKQPNATAASGLVGGTVGCNYQMSNFVIGVEGDDSWTGGAKASATLIAPFNPAFVETTHQDWLATARARAGYAVDNWLLYVTGGGAWAGYKVEEFGPGGAFASQNATAPGWTVGAGVEWGLTQNWSAKVEYLYAGFQDKHLFGETCCTVEKRTFDDQIVRAGLNYRLDFFGDQGLAR